MKRATIVATAAAFAVGGVVAIFASSGWIENVYRARTSPQPVWTEVAWTEVAWPFAIDQWGQGKAFQCRAADCGTEVNLYVRAKIGFCNCTTGVADDDELERLSDFDIMGSQPKSMLADGHPVSVAWMKGRSRAYAVDGLGRKKTGLSIALNDHCDAIVATAVLGHDKPAAVEPGVIAFLNGRTVLRWAELTLGL